MKRKYRLIENVLINYALPRVIFTVIIMILLTSADISSLAVEEKYSSVASQSIHSQSNQGPTTQTPITQTVSTQTRSTQAPSTQTRSTQTASTITWVSVPGLSFLELQPHYLAKMPHVEELIVTGAIAAMNIRTPERGIEDTYVSIGASAATSTMSKLQAWQRDERTEAGMIDEQYRRFQGVEPGKAELIIPHYAAMNSANNRLGASGVIGAFGTSLRNSGIDTYVYGDLRQGPFMLMDNRGLVEYGQVGVRLTNPDVHKALGITTNYDQLYDLWQAEQERQASSVIVLELGDLQRLYTEQRSYEEDIFDEVKVEVLQEIDEFIGKLVQAQLPTDQLWIFSPIVNPEAWSVRWMFSPLLIAAHESDSKLTGSTNEPDSKLLYSPSTHRAGIVSMYDLAPTILGKFNIEQPPHMIGLPLETLSSDHTLTYLMGLNREIAQVYKLRPQLLYPFVIYQIIVLLVSLTLVLLQWTRGYRVMALPLYTIMISPLAMLLMGWLVKLGWSTRALLLFFVLFLLVAAWTATQFPVYGSLIAICGLTVIVLFIDGFTGVHAMRSSILGYDPMIGARYYGVGNEYMGVWIGAAILGAAAGSHYWWGRKNAIFISVLLFTGILIYMASPSWGTNAGGAITAVVAFGIAWLRWFSNRRQLQHHWGKLLLWMLLFVVIALLGLWLFNGDNRHSNESASHIGRAMDQLLSGNLEVIGGIIWRKLMMNLHLIGVSVWSKALFVSMLVMAVLLMKPAGLFRRWQEAHTSLMHGLSAIATGAIVALLANDSGIVAAATMMIFVAIPMLLIRLQELGASEAVDPDYSDNASHSA